MGEGSGLTPSFTKRDNVGVDATTGSDTAGREDAVASALASADELLRDVAVALHRNPRLDPDTVRHVLTLLRLDPLTRLNRSLLRGRAAALYRP